MSKRRIGYIVVTVLLLIGLVLAYFALEETGPPPAASGSAAQPVRVTWAGGEPFVPAPGTTQLIFEQAKRELAAVGVAEHQLPGYTVELTVDKAANELGERILQETLREQPGNLRTAMVAVDPRTGRVVVYNAHQPQARPQFDYAGAWQPTGGLFMPFTLVALLHEGKGLATQYDGAPLRTFGESTVSNVPGADCQQCSVAEAMRLSVKTVFAHIAYNEVGTQAVARAVVEAGMPTKLGEKAVPLDKDQGALDVSIASGDGQYQARVIDIAGAYATFAANGTRRAPHIVAKVVRQEDNAVVLDVDEQVRGGKPAFNAQDPDTNAKIARNVTESLLPVPAHNNIPCAENRPCAGKTGVSPCPLPENRSAALQSPPKDTCAAWMAGYTPQISAAVWVGSDDESVLTDKSGAAVTSALPGQAWQGFMDAYLKDKPVEQFPAFVPIG